MIHLLSYADWKHWFILCHCVAGVLFTETFECCAQFDGRTSSIFNEGLRGDEEAASVQIEEPKCTRLSWIGSDSSVSCLSVLILWEFTTYCVELVLCFERLSLNRREGSVCLYLFQREGGYQAMCSPKHRCVLWHFSYLCLQAHFYKINKAPSVFSHLIPLTCLLIVRFNINYFDFSHLANKSSWNNDLIN